MKKFLEKISMMPLKAKIIACVVAVVIVGSGVGVAVVSSKSAKSEVTADKEVKKSTKTSKKKATLKAIKDNSKKLDEETANLEKNKKEAESQAEGQGKTNNQKAQSANVEGQNSQPTSAAPANPAPANPEPQPEPVDARGEACVHNCGKTVFKDQASYDTFKRFITDNYKLEAPDDDFDISMFPASMQEYISNSAYYNIPYTYKGVTYYGATDDTDLY
jgi:FtsZ-interacting cell division protein ZipA